MLPYPSSIKRNRWQSRRIHKVLTYAARQALELGKGQLDRVFAKMAEGHVPPDTPHARTNTVHRHASPATALASASCSTRGMTAAPVWSNTATGWTNSHAN